MTDRFIREGRMGPPKCYKTGAVVNTYPKPMLVFEGDEGGLDVSNIRPVWLRNSAEITEACNGKPEGLFAYNFVEGYAPMLDTLYAIQKDANPFNNLVNVINALTHAKACPWKTVVLDPITRLSDIIYSHLAFSQPGLLADAAKWAPNIALKIKQILEHLYKLPCHVVFIMHSEMMRNETTGMISWRPIIYSKYRDMIAALPSQFFFADIESGKPVVFTQPQGFVKGIGCRWPANLPQKLPADYQSIYEKTY